MSVRLILDESALRAYVESADLAGLDVAELIFTVGENGDLAGIPALTIVALYNEIDAAAWGRLVELVSADDGPTVILPLLEGEVLTVAEMTHGLPLQSAHAVAEARKHAAPLATFDAKPFEALLPAHLVLDMAEDF